MKALQSIVVGGPETLKLNEAPAPQAGPGQALVEVRACGVNFPDVLVIEDRYQTKFDRPFTPGGEISGVVAAVGQGVTSVKPGDRVLGMVFQGGMAELALADADRLVKIPDEMPFDEAAAFILTYGTSHHALKDRARLKTGERLLILGAAGGVGLSAIQLAKATGATVVAAVSSPQKAQLCRQHGADETVVYARGPLGRDGQKALSQQFKAVAGADGFDVVYDAVGGEYSEPALRALAWEGRFLVIGFAAGDIPKIPLNLALLKGCDILGVWWGEWVDRNPQLSRQENLELMDIYRAGKIKPFVSEHFTLEHGGEAISHLAGRKALGKVVVTIG